MANEKILDTFYNATTGERLDLIYHRSGEYAGAWSIRHRGSWEEATQSLVLFSEDGARRTFLKMRRNEGRRPVDGRERFNERTRKWEYA